MNYMPRLMAAIIRRTIPATHTTAPLPDALHVQVSGDPYAAAELISDSAEPVMGWLVRCGRHNVIVTETPELGGAA